MAQADIKAIQYEGLLARSDLETLLKPFAAEVESIWERTCRYSILVHIAHSSAEPQPGEGRITIGTFTNGYIALKNPENANATMESLVKQAAEKDLPFIFKFSKHTKAKNAA